MVLENPWVHELSLSNFVSMFTEVHRANWHPIVVLSHSIDFALFGADPGPHHLVNVFLHSMNTLLVMWLCACLLPIYWQANERLWIAALTALIFAMHPQHVESVAWVVERKDVLYALFALGALVAYQKQRLVITFLLFLLALASKPMAVTLPVVMILMDAYSSPSPLTIRWLVKKALAKSHLFIAALAIGLLTLNTQSMAMPSTASLPLELRALNAIDNTWFYLSHYLLPTSLSPFYPYPSSAEFMWSIQFWMPGALFISSTLLTTIILWRRRVRWPLLLMLFYFVTLAPVSGLIHVGPAKATDHYVYLATLPFSLITALGIVYAWKRWIKSHALIAMATATYLLALFSTTQIQVSYWANPYTLWTRVVSLHPDSAFGHRNLSAAYLAIGDLDNALKHAELSEQLGSPDREYVEEVRRIKGTGPSARSDLD